MESERPTTRLVVLRAATRIARSLRRVLAVTTFHSFEPSPCPTPETSDVSWRGIIRRIHTLRVEKDINELVEAFVSEDVDPLRLLVPGTEAPGNGSKLPN